jgi:hypothetical protein
MGGGLGAAGGGNEMEVDEEVAELRDTSGCVWAVVFALAVVGEGVVVAVAEASGLRAWESGLMDT